jgi:hypothetical protein
MNLIMVQNTKAHAKVIYLSKEQVEGKVAGEQQKLPTTMEEMRAKVIEDLQRFHQNIGDGHALLLSPGNNPVLENIWAAAKKTEDVQKMLGNGELVETVFENAKGTVPVEVAAMSGVANLETVSGLSGKDAPSALALISGENHINVLESWLTNEVKGGKREGIIKALRDRLNYLKNNVRSAQPAAAVA